MCIPVHAEEGDDLLDALKRLRETAAKKDRAGFDAIRAKAEQQLADAAPSATGVELRLVLALADARRERTKQAHALLDGAEADARDLDAPLLLGRVFFLRGRMQYVVEGDPGAAAKSFGVAAEEFRRADSTANLVRALGAQADCADDLDAPEEEIALGQQAVALARGLADKSLLAGRVRNLSVALNEYEQHEQMLKLHDEVRPLLDPKGHAHSVAFLLFSRARALNGLGRLREADAAYEETAALLLKSGARRECALMLLDHARDLFEERRDADQALATLGRARKVVKPLKDVGLDARIHRDTAYYLYVSDRLAESMREYELAIETARASGRTKDEATVTLELAHVHHELSRPAVCLELLRGMPHRFPGFQAQLLGALSLKTRCHAALLDSPAMLETARSLLEYVETATDVGTNDRAEALFGAAVSLAQAGLHEEARKVAQGGFDLHGTSPPRMHNGFYAMGMVALSANNLTEAETWLRRSIDHIQAGGFASVAGRRIQLARVLLRRGDKQGAIAEARLAIEDEGTSLGGFGEIDTLDSRTQVRIASDILLTAAATEEGAFDVAFWAMDQTRAGSLTGEVVHRDSLLAARVSPDLLAAERRARSRLRAAKRQGDASSDAERQELAEAYRELEDAVARTQRDVRAAAPRLRALPVAADELAAMLPPDGLFIAFQVTDTKVPNAPHRVYALVVGKQLRHIVDLGAADAVAKDVATWVRLARNPRTNGRKIAKRLYRALLAPIGEPIETARNIIVSPDGFLSFLPFEALLRDVDGSERRLIETHEISYAHSATLLALLSKAELSAPPPSRLLALGDPIREPAVAGKQRLAAGGWTRLPATRDEVMAIGDVFGAGNRQLLLGADATLERLLIAVKETPRLRALHLACHGDIDTARPRLTGMVLADDELTLDDVYRMSIDAELVTLSACNSGRGKLANGEGVLGLVRGFLVAGGRRILVSNWQVPDDSTQLLMTAFYQRLMKAGDGHAAALRRAKLDLLAKKETAHPHHWAAFVLWGPGD